MPDSNENQRHVKRIVLPGGKQIEVVYFPELGRESDAQDPVLPTEAELQALEPEVLDGLHFCPECCSDLVYPVDWSELGRGSWEVSLRCPDCEWHHTGEYAQDVLDSFDEELDRGTEVLMRDLKQLARANMAEQVDRFVAALEADAIQPMDF